MGTSNTALQITELDFHEIKNNLKEFLRGQPEFTDFDFEGSGMSILLDVLAYNTHMGAFYLNMIANEMFLDTAQLRNSILSHAKLTNYVPESRHGAMAKVNILITPSSTEDQNTTSVTLDKYTRLLGADKDGINYPFIALNTNTAVKVNGTFTFSNVWIRQGEVITRQFPMDSDTNASARFKIPSANVDLDTLLVSVQTSNSNNYTETYSLVSDITTLRGNTRSYFVEEDTDSKYTVYFGDNVLGKRPDDGNIVILTYLDTVGPAANNIGRFNFVESVGGVYSDNVRITSVSASTSGTEKESVEDIRFRAPFHYTTQNRAITELDYKTLITQDYPNIDSVSVWGGEDNDPPVYGKVYISLKTRQNYALTNLEKENIKNALIRTRNVLTIIPEIVDPDYEYLLLRGSVGYNPSATSLTGAQLLGKVRTAIASYVNTDLNNFDSTFRKSRLQLYIDNADNAITSSDITVYLQKRVLIETGVSRNYSIPFNAKLRKGDYTTKLYSFPPLTVTDLTGVSRDVFIEEVPNSFTGIDAISITNSGRNYETVPTVTITGDGIGATAEAVIVNRRIDQIRVTSPGSNYTRATVSITGGGGTEASATAVLEAKNGLLRTFYYKSNGEKVIVDADAGTINYETGEVFLSQLKASAVVPNDFYALNYLTINAPAANQIIYPQRNRIITLDTLDASAIQIEMVPE